MDQNQSPTPVPSVAPEKSPQELDRPHTNRIRASEVIIIITVIFAVIICVLLVLGAIAVVHNFPTWWKQIFGLQLSTWFA